MRARDRWLELKWEDSDKRGWRRCQGQNIFSRTAHVPHPGARMRASCNCSLIEQEEIEGTEKKNSNLIGTAGGVGLYSPFPSLAPVQNGPGKASDQGPPGQKAGKTNHCDLEMDRPTAMHGHMDTCCQPFAVIRQVDVQCKRQELNPMALHCTDSVNRGHLQMETMSICTD